MSTETQSPSVTDIPVPIVYIPGPPERVFGIDDVVGTSAHTVGTMTTDHSLLAPTALPGLMGVLIDTAIGSAAVAYRPTGGWAVTTDLTITFCGSLPAAGAHLIARSRAIQHDDGSATSAGTVTDETGTVLAAVTERIEFSTLEPQLRETQPAHLDVLSGRTLPERLGLRTTVDGVELDVVDPVINPAGNLHGGIAIYLSDLAGSRALATHTPGLVATTMQMTYLRPGPATTTMRFVADIDHAGRNSALVVVRSVRPDGKVCTRATITYRRRPQRNP